MRATLSIIVNLYMGKLDALNRGNYKGLKFVEKKMQKFKCVIKELRSTRISGHCIIDEIFIVRQI